MLILLLAQIKGPTADSIVTSRKSESTKPKTDQKKDSAQNSQLESFLHEWLERDMWREKQNATTDSERIAEQKANDLQTFWLLFGTVVGTGILAYFSYRQYRLSDVTAQRQLRAYVAVYPGKGRGERFATFTEKNISRATFRVVNSGLTPAYNTTFWIKEAVTSLPEQSYPFATGPDKEWESASAVIHRDGPSLIFSRALRLSPENFDLENIRYKQTFVYWYGEVKYRDAFEKEHTTKFRFSALDVDEGMAYSGRWGNEAD